MAPIRRAIVAFLAAGTGSAVRLDDEVFQDPIPQQQQPPGGISAQTADAPVAQQAQGATAAPAQQLVIEQQQEVGTTTPPVEIQATNSGAVQKRMGEAAAKGAADAPCGAPVITTLAPLTQEEELLKGLAVRLDMTEGNETKEAPLPQVEEQQVAQVDTAKVNSLVDSGQNLFNADGSLKEGVLREVVAGQQAPTTTTTTTGTGGTETTTTTGPNPGDEMMLLTQGKTTKDLDNENKKLRKELADFTFADSPCREVRKQSYLSFDNNGWMDNTTGELLGESLAASVGGSGAPALAGVADALAADAKAAAPGVAASVREAFPQLDASKEKIEAELMKAAGVMSQPGTASLVSEDPFAPAVEDPWANTNIHGLEPLAPTFGYSVTPTFVPGDGFVAEYKPPQNTESFRGGPAEEKTNWHENTQVVAQVEGAVHQALGNDYAKHYADYHHEDQFSLLPNVGKDIDGHIASLDANPHYH